MYTFYHQTLTWAFDEFFTSFSEIHKCNAQLADDESYYISNFRTNYEIFDIRLFCPKIRNSVPHD